MVVTEKKELICFRKYVLFCRILKKNITATKLTNIINDVKRCKITLPRNKTIIVRISGNFFVLTKKSLTLI